MADSTRRADAGEAHRQGMIPASTTRCDPLWLDDMPPHGLFQVVLADREQT